MKRYVAAAVVCALALVACDDDPAPVSKPAPVRSATPSPSPAPSMSESPSPAPVAECRNAGEVTSDEAFAISAPVSDDVDGDGTDDDIRLFLDPTGEQGCEAFLVVEASSGTYVAPVWRHGEAGGLPQPSFAGTAPVNDTAGAEIILNEAAGASSQFVGLYSIVDWVLQPVMVDGPGPWGDLDGLFAYGGSAGHVEAVDCIGDEVVISLAVPASGKRAQREGLYDIERYFFDARGATLVRDRTEGTTTKFAFNDFPEFASAPFAHCT